jgi:murein L,D-transpeptidase YcbB/YkuD
MAMLLLLPLLAGAAVAEDDAIAREIEALVGSGAPWKPDQRDALQRAYAPGAYLPIWFTAGGARRPAVIDALAALRAAPDRGLAAETYDVDALAREIAAAAMDPVPLAVARADVGLTRAVLQFLSDLRNGRIRPQVVEPHYRAPAKPAVFVASLRDAVAENRLSAMIDAAEPSLPLYSRLKQQLARYRLLAAQPLSPLPDLPPKVTKVEPGGAYAGVAALHERLVRVGDLPPAAAAPRADRYGGELVEAVTAFQRRHGLEPDGVLGRQTLAALDVPLAQRVRQIEITLERLRWLPELPARPVITVNIPAFRLLVFADATAPDRPALAMPVIVGRAMRTETPVFIGEMRYLEFSPYWNVPPNILKNELLPTLARDPAYLGRHDMEMVGTRGDRSVTTVVDGATLAALRGGELRLRQRPGARNALGGVKFVLPNTMDIYLHATPARELFARTRRDFSHGCIRVADPMGLTRFVLRDQPEWTDGRIEAAMAAGRTTTVRLTAAVPVVVFYATAIVDSDGRALFLDDVYGHDRELDRALRAASAAPR